MKIIAEFGEAESLIRAAAHLRERGYTRSIGLTPFPLPELDMELGIQRSRLPYTVFAVGLTGTVLAFLIIWWTNAVDYRLDVAGRPFNSFITDIPIMFETTVLFAALAAFALVFAFAGMPRLWDAWSEVDGVERTTIDRYWLAIDTVDPAYDPTIVDEMRGLGALGVRRVEIAT